MTTMVNPVAPKSRLIQLRKMPAVPPRGLNLGRFLEIKEEPGKNSSGEEIRNLKVLVELEAKNPQGQPYQLAKTYNLSGRGLAAFQKDIRSWYGRSLTDAELDGFDPGPVTNQPVMVQTDYRKDGKELISIIKAFLAVPQPEAAQA